MSKPDFWTSGIDQEKVTGELTKLNETAKPLVSLKNDIENLKQYIEMTKELKDESLDTEIKMLYEKIKNEIKEKEVLAFLSGEFDDKNVIFEIHAGAGGTESCDWTLMLSRMYNKYFDNNGYKYEIIDEVFGEEAGIKSISYIVKKEFAYGYLKCEKGVHRLVRLSPFDSNNRRHTSFAAVDVIPEFDNDVNVEIKDNDIKVDVYRSSGAGGQGVNTTDSAVRITHIPTGIVVTCQNERSQIKNKETALKVLKSKLYQIKLKENQDQINSIKSDHSGIEFGSQIRSYVMHPYSLVKDHRTGYETSNVLKVLDGDIKKFIESYLKKEG